MASMVSSGILPQRAALVLYMRNERPILAADFARLFGDLANDYRRVSGGHGLIVARLRATRWKPEHCCC